MGHFGARTRENAVHKYRNQFNATWRQGDIFFDVCPFRVSGGIYPLLYPFQRVKELVQLDCQSVAHALKINLPKNQEGHIAKIQYHR